MHPDPHRSRRRGRTADLGRAHGENCRRVQREVGFRGVHLAVRQGMAVRAAKLNGAR